MADSLDAADEVVEATSTIAAQVFDGRLASVYLLGSLAHGGFSPALSDIDMGLVLEDPLLPDDEARIAIVKERAVDLGLSLADRLSLFWGSPESLREARQEGRFPPLDRLDLILHGRLLVGRDTRAGLSKPAREELVVGAVRFALRVLRRPEEIQQVLDPALLVGRGIRHASKRVLFPVRFLYTARTGEIGPVEAAAEHYRRSGGSAAAVVAEAIRWRSEPPVAGPELFGRLSNHLLPLYIEFLDDHLRRMEAYGETELAAELRAWCRDLGVPDAVPVTQGS
jgi:predicted nucleotidyltransferase